MECPECKVKFKLTGREIINIEIEGVINKKCKSCGHVFMIASKEYGETDIEEGLSN